ncbi:MAG TPA: MBL fold metallo-hydrolase [Thermoanaerobaculia bacterium]|nr:MBL fold metallo-hydrolase [Thermoanaerobaculia bacterium]
MTLRVAEILAVGPLACNCAILVDGETAQAAVVDPGDEPERILDALGRAGAKAVVLLHTHAHFDHIAAAGAVHRATRAPIRLHPEDRFLYEMLPEQGRLFGFRFDDPEKVTEPLVDRETIPVGSSEIRVIHTPGHSPGSVSFLSDGDEPVLLSGDTLFRESIGRTDLWGGSFPEIERSIRERLYSLPDALRVVPGHGEETTIGWEKRRNPFVRSETI